MSACTTSAPALVSAFALSLFGSRVIARTAKPPFGSARIARASPPPCVPVAPTTAMIFLSAIEFLFTATTPNHQFPTPENRELGAGPVGVGNWELCLARAHEL